MKIFFIYLDYKGHIYNAKLFICLIFLEYGTLCIFFLIQIIIVKIFREIYNTENIIIIIFKGFYMFIVIKISIFQNYIYYGKLIHIFISIHIYDGQFFNMSQNILYILFLERGNFKNIYILKIIYTLCLMFYTHNIILYLY